jgi:uncharacterized iron-regulated membrane protein
LKNIPAMSSGKVWLHRHTASEMAAGTGGVAKPDSCGQQSGNWPEVEMSFERFVRTLHAWMGVLILPWVVLAGFTGLYMNHADLMNRLLPAAEFEVASFAAAPGAGVQDQASALALVKAAVPGEAVIQKADDSFLDRPVFVFVAGQTEVMVDKSTGNYWLQSRYDRSLHAPDGSLVQREIRWNRVMDSLHSAGWLGRGLGTWPADIAATALMIFGVSGLFLFLAPRLRRLRNRRVKTGTARL